MADSSEKAGTLEGLFGALKKANSILKVIGIHLIPLRDIWNKDKILVILENFSSNEHINNTRKYSLCIR